MSRIFRFIAILLLAGTSIAGVQAATLAPASAATCSTSGPSYDRTEFCSGIRHEVLAAKYDRGTNSWSKNGQSMYFNGVLTDTAADSECTWIRVRVTNAYWPNGNVLDDPAWRVCGAGNSKVVGITLDQAFMYPGTVEFKHCALTGGSQIQCPTIFSRNV